MESFSPALNATAARVSIPALPLFRLFPFGAAKSPGIHDHPQASAARAGPGRARSRGTTPCKGVFCGFRRRVMENTQRFPDHRSPGFYEP
jgi:hypothetical protein